MKIKILLLALTILATLYVHQSAEAVNPGLKKDNLHDNFREDTPIMELDTCMPIPMEDEYIIHDKKIINEDTNYDNYDFTVDGFNYQIVDRNMVTLVRGPYKKMTSVTIPARVSNKGISYAVWLGPEVFKDCNKLEYVDCLNHFCTFISNSAFEGCSSLKSIRLPNYIESIGQEAFMGCTSLSNIVLPASLVDIGDYAFEGCTALKSIVLPDKCERVGCGAFMNCTSLENVKIMFRGHPNMGFSVGSGSTFENCRNLKTIQSNSIIQPFGFSYGEDGNVVEGCVSLQRVEMPLKEKRVKNYKQIERKVFGPNPRFQIIYK